DKDEIIANFEIMKSTAFNTEELETQKIELQNELEVVAKMIQDIINENAHTALDQEEYQRKNDGHVKRIESDKTKPELVNKHRKDKTKKYLLDMLQKQDK